MSERINNNTPIEQLHENLDEVFSNTFSIRKRRREEAHLYGVILEEPVKLSKFKKDQQTGIVLKTSDHHLLIDSESVTAYNDNQDLNDELISKLASEILSTEWHQDLSEKKGKYERLSTCTILGSLAYAAFGMYVFPEIRTIENEEVYFIGTAASAALLAISGGILSKTPRWHRAHVPTHHLTDKQTPPQ